MSAFFPSSINSFAIPERVKIEGTPEASDSM